MPDEKIEPDYFATPARFTPRRPGSIWSVVNMRRVAALKKTEL